MGRGTNWVSGGQMKRYLVVLSIFKHHRGETDHEVFIIDSENGIGDVKTREEIIDNLVNCQRNYLFQPDFDRDEVDINDLLKKCKLEIYEINKKCEAIGERLIIDAVAICKQAYDKENEFLKKRREEDERRTYEKLKKKFEGTT